MSDKAILVRCEEQTCVLNYCEEYLPIQFRFKYRAIAQDPGGNAGLINANLSIREVTYQRNLT